MKKIILFGNALLTEIKNEALMKETEFSKK